MASPSHAGPPGGLAALVGPGGPPTGPLPTGSRAIAVIVTTALFTLFTVAFIVLRGIHKYNAPYAKFALDDGLLLLATLLFLGQNAIVIAAVKFGFGEHLLTLVTQHPDYVAHSLKLPLFAQAVGSFALCFAKLSVGATLLHLCRGVTYLDKRLALTYKSLIISAIVLAVLGNIIAVGFILNGCEPGVSRTSLCKTPPTMAAFLQLCSNLVVNLLFVVSTMWLLRKLKLAARDRLAIDLLLCFMFSASITSIVKAIKVPEALLDPKEDLTWDVPIISVLLIAEIGLSIMAACLPSIRRVFGRHFPSHWRFWRRLRVQNDDIDVDNESPLPHPGRLGRTPCAPSQEGDSIEKDMSSDKTDWVSIGKLEDGAKLSGSASLEELHDEKHNCASAEHCSHKHFSERYSEPSSGHSSW